MSADKELFKRLESGAVKEFSAMTKKAEDKISTAEKQRYDKIKRLTALLCGVNPIIDTLISDMQDKPFKTGGRITVDGEIIRIKNKSYEARQLQKIVISTEGSMRIYDRYGKKLCGSLTLNSSPANVELFCLWARKHKIPAEAVSGIPEKVILSIFLGVVTMVVALVKVLSRIYG